MLLVTNNFLKLKIYLYILFINRLKNLGATNLHVATFDSVIDTSGKYNDLNDGDPYQYNGHWSWIYFDNNEADCDEHGEKVWQWIGEQVK